MDRKTAKKLKLISGGGVILLFIVIGFSALDGFVSPYKTVSDVVNNQGGYTDRQVQVEGDVVKETVSWNPPVLTFVITDGKNRLNVRYKGALPGSFPTGDVGTDSKIDVVVIGSVGEDKEFKANQVLVKCPSKYEQKLNETSLD